MNWAWGVDKSQACAYILSKAAGAVNFQVKNCHRTVSNTLFSAPSCWSHLGILHALTDSKGTILDTAATVFEAAIHPLHPIRLDLRWDGIVSAMYDARNVSRTQSVAMLKLHCVPKTLTFLFLNNSVKNEPISIIFGTLNHEKLDLRRLPTSPTCCSYCTWGMSKKSFFSSGLLRRGLDCSRAS